jgi:uncharacterized protein YbjT (DUF2867 family)
VSREDAIRALIALLAEAAIQAERDYISLRPEATWDRDLADFVAEQLVRKAPTYGLSIRLDDGSEIPAA